MLNMGAGNNFHVGIRKNMIWFQGEQNVSTTLCTGCVWKYCWLFTSILHWSPPLVRLLYWIGPVAQEWSYSGSLGRKTLFTILGTNVCNFWPAAQYYQTSWILMKLCQWRTCAILLENFKPQRLSQGKRTFLPLLQGKLLPNAESTQLHQ